MLFIAPLTYLILISLFLPFTNSSNYFPVLFYILWMPLELLVHSSISQPSNLIEFLEDIWFILSYLSVWAGPILILSNIRILLTNNVKWVQFNRIIVPIFLLCLIITNGIYLIVGGIFNYGFWGYILVIFLGGVIEVYLYKRNKKERFPQGKK